MIDPSRAAFVSKDYRYEVVTRNDVRADFPKSREIVLETNLSEADAATLAAQISAQNDALPLGFKIEVEGAIRLEDFDLTVPHFTLVLRNFATDRTFKAIAAEIDYVADTTTYTVRAV